jgi:hypothetical protein
MAWSASLQNGPVRADQIDHDALSFGAFDYDAQPGAVKEQIDTAIQAAKDLAESGALGNDDDLLFHVALYGHANPRHEQPETGPCDTISITVAQWPRGDR